VTKNVPLSTRNQKPSTSSNMGKIIPRSFERIRSGEQIQITTFTTVVVAAAAGVTPAKFPGHLVFFTQGLSGTPCLAISDGTVWKAAAFNATAT